MTHAIHATLTGHPDNPPGLGHRVGVTLLLKPDFHHRGGFTLCLDKTGMRA